MRRKIVTAAVSIALLLGVAAAPASAGKRIHGPTEPASQRWD